MCTGRTARASFIEISNGIVLAIVAKHFEKARTDIYRPYETSQALRRIKARTKHADCLNKVSAKRGRGCTCDVPR